VNSNSLLFWDKFLQYKTFSKSDSGFQNIWEMFKQKKTKCTILTVEKKNRVNSLLACFKGCKF